MFLLSPPKELFVDFSPQKEKDIEISEDTRRCLQRSVFNRTNTKPLIEMEKFSIHDRVRCTSVIHNGGWDPPVFSSQKPFRLRIFYKDINYLYFGLS